MSDFIDKFRKLRGLTNLEIAVRGAKDNPIPNLGELVADYIDTKGEKYDPSKLVSVFAPRSLKPNYTGFVSPENPDEQLHRNHKKMLASLSSLIANPQYNEKVEQLIQTNYSLIDGMDLDRAGHPISIIDDMEASLKQQRKLTNNNRPTPKPY